MNYITAKELSEKWEISARRICILCKEGRIAGSVKIGNTWMIPENVKKPEDGRKVEIKKGINPLSLIYNPIYFDNSTIIPSEDDLSICNIQKKYILGNIMEAYDDIDKALGRCSDDRYRCVYYFLKYVIGEDIGIRGEEGTLIRLIELLDKNKASLKMERFLIDLYTEKVEGLTSIFAGEFDYEEIIPLICLIVSKNKINNIMKTHAKGDISCCELLCNEIDKRDCPLISVYFHLYLAIYYNIVAEVKNFEIHYNKALEICLPRKWYTPLAEYSLTVDLKIIESIDKEAYLAIEKLSEEVICSYLQSGLFDSIEYLNNEKKSQYVQVGYKVFQGKNNEVIAEELGISKYRVKMLLEEMMSCFGINSKKEIKNIIMKNIFV